MRFSLLVMICLTLISTKAPVHAQPQIFLQQKLSASLVEFPSQALPIWADFQAEKPTLILFSRDPFLQPIPTSIREQLNQLNTATSRELLPRLSPQVADPLLLPRMTLRAAIETGLLTSVVWIFPSRAEVDQLELKLFRQQLLESGAISRAEAESFSQQQNGFSGMIGNTIIRALPLELLDNISDTSLLHIDLSYFSPLYKGEIKTPLYPLLYKFLKTLRSLELKSAALTISLSNLDGNLPLATRFIGSTLAEISAKPKLLDQPLPEIWDLRQRALYLGNFFQKEKIFDLYRKILSNSPEDASINYALYLNLRQFQKGNEALAALAQATSIDPAYGFEYLQLVPIALEKGQPDEALKMFSLAEAAFPSNPMVSLQKAQLLIDLNEQKQAYKLLERLAEQPWSKVFYPEMKQSLKAQLPQP